MKFERRAGRSIATSAFLALAVSLSAAGAQAKSQFLQASDAAAGQQFGDGLASDGATLVVGAPGGNGANGRVRGTVYVFASVNGDWAQQAEIPAPSDALLFGFKVGVQGNTIVVGATTKAANGVVSSAGYVFGNVNGAWTLQALLVPAEPHGGIDGVAIDGNTVVLGSTSTSTSMGNTGAAFVFVNNGGAWTEQAEIAPGDSQTAGFGSVLRVTGDTLLVGAPFSNVPGTAAPFTPVAVMFPGATGNLVGNAFIYTRQSGVWTQQALLVAADADFNAQFGSAVAMSSDINGTTIAIGAAQAGDDEAGRVYVYTGLNGVWSLQAELEGKGVSFDGDFGFSLALIGNTMLAGSYDDSSPPVPALLTSSSATGRSGPKRRRCFPAAMGSTARYSKANGSPISSPCSGRIRRRPSSWERRSLAPAAPPLSGACTYSIEQPDPTRCHAGMSRRGTSLAGVAVPAVPPRRYGSLRQAGRRGPQWRRARATTTSSSGRARRAACSPTG